MDIPLSPILPQIHCEQLYFGSNAKQTRGKPTYLLIFSL